MIPLKIVHIRKTELDKVLDMAMALPLLDDLMNETTFCNTSIDNVPLLQAKLGNRIVGDITVDIFKLEDNRFAVYVNSRNYWENQYLYTHTQNRGDLETLLRSIIKTFKRRYCRMCLVYVTRGLVWG